MFAPVGLKAWPHFFLRPLAPVPGTRAAFLAAAAAKVAEVASFTSLEAVGQPFVA